MNNKITINSIARELNVSPTTVSFVLNNKPCVSDILRAKVLKYVEEIGYKPYISSRKDGMYDKSLPLIGIIYAAAGGHLVDEIQRGINYSLKKSRYYELRYTFDNIHDLNYEAAKEIFFNRLISNGNIRGLIIIFLNISDVLISRLFKKNIPVVLLNNKTDYGMCVYIDNYNAIFKATESLINLGHKNIGYLTLDPTREQVWQDRFNGYKHALKKHKITYDPSLVEYLMEYDLLESKVATQKFLKENPKITAILYGSDLQAYGGMMGIKKLGLKIPNDICIIGFDDMAPNIAFDPPLSSIKQPMTEMGKIGAQLLMDAIKEKNSIKQVSVKLDAELIIRESSNFKIK